MLVIQKLPVGDAIAICFMRFSSFGRVSIGISKSSAHAASGIERSMARHISVTYSTIVGSLIARTPAPPEQTFP
jgi:hypothetical protein